MITVCSGVQQTIIDDTIDQLRERLHCCVYNVAYLILQY